MHFKFILVTKMITEKEGKASVFQSSSQQVCLPYLEYIIFNGHQTHGS